MQIELTDTLLGYNDKVNVILGYKANYILGHINSINKNGKCIVGYRACCGTMHATQKAFQYWQKSIKEFKKQGINLSTENLKVGNAYATNNGGFWNDVNYYLIPTQQKNNDKEK